MYHIRTIPQDSQLLKNKEHDCGTNEKEDLNVHKLNKQLSTTQHIPRLGPQNGTHWKLSKGMSIMRHTNFNIIVTHTT